MSPCSLNRRCLRILLPATLLAFASLGSTAPPAAAQAADSQMIIPDSGMGATTEGSRVILYSDGTWKVDEYVDTARITAVTDHGSTVELTQSQQSDGTQKKTWTLTGSGGGGPIQVVVTRAVTTNLSIHSDRDNCIPVVKVRNLTQVVLHRIVVEIDFTGPAGSHGGTSLMFGPLADGVEREEVSAPLFVPACKGLIGQARVPYCIFKDGVRCENVVIASERGVIPLSMEIEDRTN